MGRLQGKIAIVAGAGSIGPGWGNGKAAAVAFAREGASVLVVDRDRDAAAETHAIIAGEGLESEVFTGDLTDSGTAAAMVARCVERFGGLNILHNNIGVMQPGGVTVVSESDWSRIVTTNIDSFFHACRRAVPAMAKRGGGAIVNIGSLSADRYTSPMLAYSTSKGALRAFTRALAAEHGPDGIRANLIVPGMIDTPTMAKAVAERAGQTGDVAAAEARRARENVVPLGRFGSAWDIAATSVFLASDEAAYISGAEIVVDGGLSCKAP